MNESPYLNVALQDLANTLYHTTRKILTETPRELERERSIKIQFYRKDIEKNNLFNQIFKSQAVAVSDSEDGVRRCSICHWELEGDTCSNCFARVRGVVDLGLDDSDLDSNADPMDDHGDHDAYSQDMEPDSDDYAFLDDRESIEIEQYSDDGLSSGSSSPVRNYDPVYTPYEVDPWEDRDSDIQDGSLSDYSNWGGFDDDDDSPMISQAVNAPATESGDDLELSSDEDAMPVPRSRSRRHIVIDADL